MQGTTDSCELVCVFDRRATPDGERLHLFVIGVQSSAHRVDQRSVRTAVLNTRHSGAKHYQQMPRQGLCGAVSLATDVKKAEIATVVRK